MRFTLRLQRHLVVVSALAFLVSALAFLAPPAFSAVVRLGDEVVPVSQTVRLRLDARQADYTGSVTIELEVRRATHRILFHSEDQKLSIVRLEGPDGPVEPVRYERPDGELVAVETAELVPGRYTLEMDFTRPFGTRAVGLYRTEKDGEAYAFTQFEADDAREAFPCWDEPRFKIPYRMILTVPEGHLAVSNAPVAEETAADGWRTFEFQPTEPLPSYLLAIATGPLETVEMPGLGVPARIVTVQGQSHLTGTALAMTPPLLKAVENYFGSPYPFAKLDFIAVPEFWPGGMENPGAITYSDGILLADPEAVSLRQRQIMAGVIAHELAHMWFGDLVTMEWWDDLWLNESFADWMGDKVAHQVFPELDLDVSGIRSTQRILGADARATTDPVRKPVESLKTVLQGVGVAYAKGSAVLNMFEQWLGPEDFRRGVVAYISANSWGNATASSLWRALDKASGKPVSEALATFIEQPGFPLIGVEILEDGRAELTQERFRNYGGKSPDLTWKVPVTLKYQQGDGAATKTVFLVRATETIDLGLAEGTAPGWVYPKAEARGYYRWNLAPGGLRTLAENAVEVLEPRERIELLGNMAALLDAGLLGGDDYLRAVSSLANDPDPLVVRAAIGELDGVREAFVLPELEEAFAAYVRRTLRPVLEQIGMEKRPGEDEATELLRPTLLTWLGARGRDPDLLEHADSLARSYMKDPRSVDPGMVSVALGLAAFDGGRELFDELKRRFESAKTPADRGRYLSALGAFEDVEIRRDALRYSLTGPLRPDELLSIAFEMRDGAAGRELIYAWFTENYDRILERVPPIFIALAASMAGGCSEERLEHARSFFMAPEHNVPGTERQLRMVAEGVRDCVSLRQREGEAVSRYLLSR